MCLNSIEMTTFSIGISSADLVVTKHRGLKLDGAIDQGEICNSLKCENFSKSILEKFDEMPMTLNKKYDGVFQSKYSGMRKWSF